MKADVNSFLDEFVKKSLGNQYVIPVYQRNYTWNKNHIKTILKDLRNLLIGTKNTHFLGTIVYSVKQGNEVFEREIVDGQQRLTTLFLMLYALRDISLENGDFDNAGRLKEEYLENKYVSDKYKLRLKPLVSDDNIYQMIADNKFKEIIADEKNTASKVYINYMEIKNEFKKWIVEENYDVLSIRKAIDKFQIVYIQIDDNDDAQSIFEKINSTGETLTPADLIRNYVLMNKPNDLQEEYYKKYWLKLEKYMNEDSKTIAEFLRLYLATKTFSLCNQNAVYETFKNFWENSNLIDEDILSDIIKYASYYYTLYYGKESEILYAQNSIKELRKIKSNMPSPFIMEMMNLYENNKISEKVLSNIISLVNTYMIRRHMMRLDTSDITRLFPQVLHRVIILCNQYSYDEIEEIVKKCLINDNRQKSAYMPDDIQLSAFLDRANAYTLKVTRLILDKIELFDNSAPVALANLSVEHVMPQTPNNYWLTKTNGDRQEYDVQVNRIGNLTLASKSDNSEMGNSSFEDKKKIIHKTSHIKLNESILNSEEWNVEKINERTEELIQKFIKLFPYASTEKEYLDKENEKIIHIDNGTVYVQAIYKNNNEIEVLEGSTIDIDAEPTSDKNKTIRKTLIDENIVSQASNGEWVFTRNYLFSNLSESASVILGGSRKGISYWKDENNLPLKKSEYTQLEIISNETEE